MTARAAARALCGAWLLATLAAPADAAGKEKKTAAAKAKLQSVTGLFVSFDEKAGTVTVDQKTKAGRKLVVFTVTPATRIFWSKASMKVVLSDLKPGVKVVVQFAVKKDALVAVKIVLPGGMKEAAAAIIGGKVKGGDKK